MDVGVALNSVQKFERKSPNRLVLQPRCVNDASPSSMKEWVQHQRLLREGQKNETETRSDARSFSPKSLFKHAPTLRQVDNVIGNCINENVAPFRDLNEELNPLPEAAVTSVSREDYIHEAYANPEPFVSTDDACTSSTGILRPLSKESSGHKNVSKVSKISKIFLSEAQPDVFHTRSPSSPLEFVKPLAPSYRLANHKSISVASSVSLSCSPHRPSSVSFSDSLVSPRNSSSSVPSSPRKPPVTEPLSVSYDELCVVVRDPDVARQGSASNLTVCSTDEHFIRSVSNVSDRFTNGNAAMLGRSLNEEQIHGYTFTNQDDPMLVSEDAGALLSHHGTLSSSRTLEERQASNGEWGVRDCLSRLYCSLQNGCETSTLSALEALKECYPSLPSLLPHAAPLYHLEMYEAMMDAEGALSLEEVCGGVVLVGAVASINTAVRTGDERALLSALTDRSAHMQDVRAELTEEYLTSMRAAVGQLAAVNAAADTQLSDGPAAVCPLLSFLHIQQIIDQVNTAAEDRMSQAAHGEQQLPLSEEEDNVSSRVLSWQSTRPDEQRLVQTDSVQTAAKETLSSAERSSAVTGVRENLWHEETNSQPSLNHQQHFLSPRNDRVGNGEAEPNGCPYISPPIAFGSKISSVSLARNASKTSLVSNLQSSFSQDIFASLSQGVSSTFQLRPLDDDGTLVSPEVTGPAEQASVNFVTKGVAKFEQEISIGESDLQLTQASSLHVLPCDETQQHLKTPVPVDDSICDEAPCNVTLRVESFKEGDGRRFLPQRSSTQNSSRKIPCVLTGYQHQPEVHSVLSEPIIDEAQHIIKENLPVPPQSHVPDVQSNAKYAVSYPNDKVKPHPPQTSEPNMPVGAASPISVISPDAIYPTQRTFNQSQQSLVSPVSGLLQSHERGSLYDTLGANVDLSSRASSTCLASHATTPKSSRNYFPTRRSFTEKETNAAVCIQRWWRLQSALTRLQLLLQRSDSTEPLSASVLLQAMAPCLSILPLTHADLRIENKMQAVRSSVSRCLRVTAQLQKQLDDLDLHIGLLLTNTMSIQDPSAVGLESDGQHAIPPTACGSDASLACVNTPSKKKKEMPERRGTLTPGLKALRKCARDRLQGYQHLFYLLQTQPRYLATLILSLTCARTTRFVESVVFSLYNYGANDRDSFLLINLFKTALEEEIRCKVLRISDIVSGEPLVVKMIVSFVRKGPGRAALREILGPLVMKVIHDKNLNLNTNPVEIYQSWLNEIEMETGQSSGRPYNVSSDEALEQPVVVKRLQMTLNTLTRLTNEFCSAITASMHKLPYTLLYLAGVMRRALSKRFPHIQDKEVLKVVGSLIYYRYINSGIVAPDAFDVITVGPHEQLSSRQRRNLATIAKTLQAAANKRGFGIDTPHLCALNPDLVTWHDSLRGFFLACCRVPPPDAVFAVTQYSEAALIHKPEIHLTLQELYETHCLLLNHRNVLAPSPSDPLHTLLDDLPPPDLSTMGDSSGKLEVCLSLSTKFSFSELETSTDSTTNSKDAHTKLFDKSKQLVVDVLLCYDSSGVDWSKTTLQDVVSSSTSPQQEERYASLKTASWADSSCDALHAAKTRLSHNLRRLQTLGLVSPADGFLQLLRAVASDVLSQRCYRSNRDKELARLSLALSQLQQKEQFLREQRESFLQYMTACRANLMQHCAKKSRRGAGSTVTYTGKRLKEKGVLVNIREFTPSQYSSVAFVFARVDPNVFPSSKSRMSDQYGGIEGEVGVVDSEVNDNENNTARGDDLPDAAGPLTASSGIFSVTVKYRGVVVDAVKISIQELLHLQYEGVRVKQMAGGAEVNVNLLLHLLNTKFFKKKK
ncbi:Ras GTPase-activating protein [Trinorchestia longiramus]|nr:Ras GTPase-activating protein [Trinorchestia longiramus]